MIELTKEANWLGVSVVNVLEFLGFEGLTEPDRLLFTELISRLTVIDLNYSNAALMAYITTLRKARTLKLPDAIVMASAVLHQAVVITNDVALLKLASTGGDYEALAY